MIWWTGSRYYEGELYNMAQPEYRSTYKHERDALIRAPHCLAVTSMACLNLHRRGYKARIL